MMRSVIELIHHTILTATDTRTLLLLLGIITYGLPQQIIPTK